MSRPELLDIEHPFILLGVSCRLFRQLRQNFAQRPLNPLHGFHDPHFLLLASAAIEGDYLQCIADVMVHLGDHAQPALNILLTLPLAKRKHVNQRRSYKADHQV